MSAETRTVLLVDDHPVVRMGLSLFLQASPGFEVCGEAGDSASARRLTETLRPDLAVLDLHMDGRDSLDLIRDMTQLHPACRILIYTAQDETLYARRVFRAGARGYVMKSAGVETVGEALRVLARGESYVSPALQKLFVEESVTGKRARTEGELTEENLSDRELQVLQLIGCGWNSTRIAAKLGLGIKTVGTYRERLKDKLGLENGGKLQAHAERFVQAQTRTEK
ncbi:MAG TPA: response regulator transcription factor [Candidatus Methylacidiphilales bacterium]